MKSLPRPSGTTPGREDVDLPCSATEAQQRPSPHRATALDWTAFAATRPRPRVCHSLRRGGGQHGEAFAVRQLQIRHRRPVAVASLRLPQVHPYTVSTYPQVQSSDTLILVCLQELAFPATPQSSYQYIRSPRPRNVPTNSASRVYTGGVTSTVDLRF